MPSDKRIMMLQTQDPALFCLLVRCGYLQDNMSQSLTY